eukprot:2789766-Rhodomonas_salina.8
MAGGPLRLDLSGPSVGYTPLLRHGRYWHSVCLVLAHRVCMPAPRWAVLMCGTVRAYGGVGCAVLTECMAVQAGLTGSSSAKCFEWVPGPPSLRSSYAMSGTDIPHAATRCSVPIPPDSAKTSPVSAKSRLFPPNPSLHLHSCQNPASIQCRGRASESESERGRERERMASESEEGRCRRA